MSLLAQGPQTIYFAPPWWLLVGVGVMALLLIAIPIAIVVAFLFAKKHRDRKDD